MDMFVRAMCNVHRMNATSNINLKSACAKNEVSTIYAHRTSFTVCTLFVETEGEKGSIQWRTNDINNKNGKRI